MAFNLENYKNQPPIVVIKDEDINGLSYFKRRLEQLFFSEVIIRNSDIKGKTAKLIIEISCNFGLRQGMSHLKAGIWAQLRKTADNSEFQHSEFYNLVEQLQEKNNFAIEVEEFSLLFNNCNIIINQLYQRSIPEQLDAILTQLANHYSELTKGLRQVPYEIFIPVYEEDTNSSVDSESLLPNVNTEEHHACDYFNFWAIYFEDHQDALMYSLQQRSIIKGELNMLND